MLCLCLSHFCLILLLVRFLNKVEQLLSRGPRWGVLGSLRDVSSGRCFRQAWSRLWKRLEVPLEEQLGRGQRCRHCKSPSKNWLMLSSQFRTSKYVPDMRWSHIWTQKWYSINFLKKKTLFWTPGWELGVCVERLKGTYRLCSGLWWHAFFADWQLECVLDARFQLSMRDSQHRIFGSQAEAQSGAMFWTLSARSTHSRFSYVTAVMKFKARADKSHGNLVKQDIWSQAMQGQVFTSQLLWSICFLILLHKARSGENRACHQMTFCQINKSVFTAI